MDDSALPRFIFDALYFDRRSDAHTLIKALGSKNISFDTRLFSKTLDRYHEDGLYPQQAPGDAAPGTVHHYFLRIDENRFLIFPNFITSRFEDQNMYYQYDNRSVAMEEAALRQYFSFFSTRKFELQRVFEESFLEYAHEFRTLLKAASDTVGLMIDNIVIKGNRTADEAGLNQVRATLSLIAIRLDYYNLYFSSEIYKKEDFFNVGREAELISITLKSLLEAKSITFRNNFRYGHKIYTSDLILVIIYIVIENAIKYTPRGGWIELSGKEDEATISIIVKNLGFKIENITWVFDRGMGSRSIRARRENPSGNGIGLFVARRICEGVLGGTIDLSQEKPADEEPAERDDCHVTSVVVRIPKNI